MPLYELLCLARPLLPREEMVKMIQRVGNAVYERGGIITSVTSYDVQKLAYPIKKSLHSYDKAHMWQLDFMVQPSGLDEVNHQLRVNESVLRWIIVNRSHRHVQP